MKQSPFNRLLAAAASVLRTAFLLGFPLEPISSRPGA